MKSFNQLHLFLIIFAVIGCDSAPQVSLGVAENFKLQDIYHVERSLTDFKADLIMLHFWADWCSHCRDEFKGLEKTYRDLKSSGFLIVAVNVGQSVEHVREIQEEYQITFPMLLDEDKKVSELYNAKGLPASFFVARLP